MGRNWLKWVLGVVVTAALVTAAVLGLTAVLGNDGSEEPDPSPAADTPAPRTIPAVRSWAGEKGPGWRPTEGTRVVADPDGPLADEAQLLARELKVPRASGDADDGDIELVLSDEKNSGEKNSDSENSDNAGGGREAYELTTRSGRVTISGTDDAGVFYGTRTLLQSVRDSGGLPEGVVRDRPDRPQRGLMLDIARKHFDADWIEDRIREMADLKLNQLHLHLSDDQAFRIESETHPEVVSEPHLTKAEVRRIVRLAAARHIAVVPEIDSPGHLGAVLDAHPELRLRNAGGQTVPGAIDITRPAAARLLDDLMKEYTPLFRTGAGPGRVWHLGGDEYAALLARDPEASYPQLARSARQQHGDRAGVQDLVTDWLGDRARTARSLGWTPEVWNDGMHRGGVVQAGKNRQVAYWTGREVGAREPVEYLREGRKVVNFNDEYLYYVLGEPNQFRYPTGERIYREWTPAVLRGTRPVPEDLSGPDRILGGRFAVWCDLSGAQTPDQVARGIRLPLTATAQKLWDPRTPRLSWPEFRRLAERVG